MYDHENSDPAIVAVKPTNKAGQPAAELVEPRAGAEGNVSQQSTGRAQYRGTVSQALARIRQAARQRKKEKFTALFHHVSIDHLAEEFSELKENAQVGQAEPGLRIVAKVEHLIAKNREHMWEGERIRIKGELMRVQGRSASQIEACLARAMAITRAQGAKSLELRAALSLARLWCDRGGPD